MEHKIFSMDRVKREGIFLSAMKLFAKDGYKNTSTDEIIKLSGISKGLLYHYFGTKEKLYAFLFEYSIDILMKEYYGRIDFYEKDILKRLKKIYMLKYEVLCQYPDIFDFIKLAMDENATLLDSQWKVAYLNAERMLFSKIDTTLLKSKVEDRIAIDIIKFTFAGCFHHLSDKFDDKAKENFKQKTTQYLSTLKKALYKKEK